MLKPQEFQKLMSKEITELFCHDFERGSTQQPNRLLSQILLLEPFLDGGTKSAIGNELVVFESHVGHRRRVVAAVEPASDGLSFVGESVSCDMWIVHYILKYDHRSNG